MIVICTAGRLVNEGTCPFIYFMATKVLFKLHILLRATGYSSPYGFNVPRAKSASPSDTEWKAAIMKGLVLG